MSDHTIIAGERVIEFIPTPSDPIKIQLHFGDKIHIADVARVLGVSRQTVDKTIFRRETDAVDDGWPGLRDEVPA